MIIKEASGSVTPVNVHTASIDAERFGINQPKANKNTARSNLCKVKITQRRKELESLKHQFNKAREEDKPPLAELNILRQLLISF